jgi:ribA/ribD-fused uncharacterized protein
MTETMIISELQEREWPGLGNGPKNDAYAEKFLVRHEKQYNINVTSLDMQEYLDAEGGIATFERSDGCRFAFFQGCWLSNFQPALFRDSNGALYNCTEQGFQAVKALFVALETKAKGFQKISDMAMDVYQKIMKSTNPLYQKLSASAKFLYMDQEMRDKWARISPEIMLRLIRLKFGQNEHLQCRLISLSGAKIFEAVPDDNLWSIGMNAHTAIFGPAPDLDPSSPEHLRLKGFLCLNRVDGQSDEVAFAGQNRLGRILEHVRDELLAGRESPLGWSDEPACEAAAELLRLTSPALDEAGPEKLAFYARVAGFAGVVP